MIYDECQSQMSNKTAAVFMMMICEEVSEEVSG